MYIQAVGPSRPHNSGAATVVLCAVFFLAVGVSHHQLQGYDRGGRSKEQKVFRYRTDTGVNGRR